MNCPRCGFSTKVISTRTTAAGAQPLRRRECCDTACGHRFSTVEVIVAAGYNTTIPKVGTIAATPGTRLRSRVDLVQKERASWMAPLRKGTAA